MLELEAKIAEAKDSTLPKYQALGQQGAYLSVNFQRAITQAEAALASGTTQDQTNALVTLNNFRTDVTEYNLSYYEDRYKR